jgi:hypothetical protein
MFLAPYGRTSGWWDKVCKMDGKIYVMMLLIGFLSALYHAGEARDLNET